MRKIEYLIKHNRFVQFIYKITFSCFFSFISFFVHVDKNLILISSFSGKRFNDSPKTIFDFMERNGFLKNYKVFWAFENPEKFNNLGLNIVKLDSLKYFFTAFKAKYWITNVNIERGLRFKKRNQIYLNTWHGTGPKTIGNAATGRKDYNFRKVNYICADGEYLKNIFIKNFNANPKNVLLCGRPREDKLYCSSLDIKKSLEEKYHIKKDDFVILYAPTWREMKNKNEISSFDITLDISKILNKIPNSKILFRAHSITSNVSSKDCFNDRFICVTDEPEIDDLFLISDVLITDYSSAQFDFIILNKPFICFAPDYEEYIEQRPLCFDLNKEYPFGVQRNTDEVIEVLHSILTGNNKLEEFRALKQKYSPFGGNATSTCIEKLFGETRLRGK